MTRIYQTFAIICTFGGLVLGCASSKGTVNSVEDLKSLKAVDSAIKDDAPPAGLKTAEPRSLTVALPESATVELLDGISHTGELSAFGLHDLTIEASGVAQTLAMAEVKEVVFSEDIWIKNPDGTRQQTRIRGLTQTLENIPTAALVIQPSNQIGILNLTDVLNSKEYAKLTGNPDRIYVLKALLFDSSGHMKARVASIKK